MASMQNADTQFALAEYYVMGTGVTMNGREANDWYRKAAEQGRAQSQYDLGNRLFHGHGGAKEGAERLRGRHVHGRPT